MNKPEQKKQLSIEEKEKIVETQIAEIEKTIESSNELQQSFEENCQKRNEAYKKLAKKNIGSKERLTHILRNSAALGTSITIDLIEPSNAFDIAIPGSQFLTDFLKDYLFGRLQVGTIGLIAGSDPAGQDFYDRPEAKALGMSIPVLSPATAEAAMRVIESLTGTPLKNQTLVKIGKFFQAISLQNIHKKLTTFFGKKNDSTKQLP